MTATLHKLAIIHTHSYDTVAHLHSHRGHYHDNDNYH